MSCTRNFQFNIKLKQTIAQRQKLESQVIRTMKPQLGYGGVQDLINCNLFFAIKEIVVFVSQFVGIGTTHLKEAVAVRKVGSGYMASLDEKVLEGIPLDNPYKSISDTKVSRRPIFDIHSYNTHKWSYKTYGGSVVSLLLHIMYNMRHRYKPSWAIEKLFDTKEFALLVPITRGNDTTKVAALVYRTKEEKSHGRCVGVVYLKQVDSRGGFSRSMAIARDDAGRFDT
jgi:hypothetical protein